MGAKHSRSRPSGSPPSGQHLLRSDGLAKELVEGAAVGSEDVVLEIGAGRGRLTQALARSAHSILAVEIDAEFASHLRHRFNGDPGVAVVEGDVLHVPLPQVPFRAFGNVPFGITTAILKRLLDDPTSRLVGADLILQYETARKRATIWPSNLISLGWLPWWEFDLVRHLHASCFEPKPSVDAGVLSVLRRPEPLLPAEVRHEYRSFIRHAFRRANVPVHRALERLDPGLVKGMMRERGIPVGAKASDLDVFDWVGLFSVARGSAVQRG